MDMLGQYFVETSQEPRMYPQPWNAIFLEFSHNCQPFPVYVIQEMAIANI
jgi:hypothetical protein